MHRSIVSGSGAPADRFEWIIRGGSVIDGTGAPARRADIGILGSRIGAVGDLESARCAQQIDATGLTVTPGFIDVHSHSDLTVLANPAFESSVLQGVTTEIVGNCGLGVAPLRADRTSSVERRLAAYGYSGSVEWRTFDDYLDRVSSVGHSANIAWLVGHNALREATGVAGETPTKRALASMRAALDDAMDRGALGLSSGLEYRPGSRASEAELIALASLVGLRGGIYASHIRNRDSRLMDAVGEFLRTVQSSGARGQISHLNIRQNSGATERDWHTALEHIERAKADGLDVMADATPMTIGIGLMINVLPDWLARESPRVIARRLRTGRTRARVIEDGDRYWRFLFRGEWDRARPLNANGPGLNGRTFSEIAAERGTSPWNVFLDTIVDAGDAMADLWMIGDLFTESHLVEMVRNPLFLFGADTLSSTLSGPMFETMQLNPISFGGEIHFLTRYGLQLQVLPVEHIVHRMTEAAACRFGLVGRGLIREGFAADIAIMDLSRLASRSELGAPPLGIAYVFVNGELTARDGRHTERRAGQHLVPDDGSGT